MSSPARVAAALDQLHQDRVDDVAEVTLAGSRIIDAVAEADQPALMAALEHWVAVTRRVQGRLEAAGIVLEELRR